MNRDTSSTQGKLHVLPMAGETPSDAGAFRLPSMKQLFVLGALSTPVGEVPQVGAELSRVDRRGSCLARWNIGRMDFTVEPGLYGLGTPDRESPVLVTANYKMSFDILRSALEGRNLWLLVLDTKGINVWCAAGKGTFGTLELLDRIRASRLEQVVSHRQLVVPQLGAPGLAAHEIKKHAGFRVVYGPVLASDLPRFLDNGCRAEPGMRIRKFSLRERLVLVPVELVQALRVGIPAILGLLLISALAGNLSFGENVAVYGLPMTLAVLCGILAGTMVTPLLLPWIPGRMFSVKGMLAGLACSVPVYFLTGLVGADHGWMMPLALLLVSLALASWFGMAFTGASTYTSLNGVRREMLRAIPVQFVGLVVGLCLWLGVLFAGA